MVTNLYEGNFTESTTAFDSREQGPPKGDKNLGNPYVRLYLLSWTVIFGMVTNLWEGQVLGSTTTKVTKSFYLASHSLHFEENLQFYQHDWRQKYVLDQTVVISSDLEWPSDVVSGMLT